MLLIDLAEEARSAAEAQLAWFLCYSMLAGSDCRCGPLGYARMVVLSAAEDGMLVD